MYEVLFVDDDLETAKEYAELVHNYTRLKVMACSSKKEALEATRRNPIAICVLDQRMPEVSGTDLYRSLQEINPRIRAIMLSGEADSSEIGAAMNLRYSKYLHKSEFRQLPAVVLREFARYQSEVARDTAFKRTYLFSVRYVWGLRGSTEYWLEAYFIESEDFIPEQFWKLADQINSGERKRITEKIELSSELRFETTIETEVSASGEFGSEVTTQLKAKLETTLKERISLGNVLKKHFSRENVRDILLPKEPSNPHELHVKSRSFYWSPVYRKIECHISKLMRPMNERTSYNVTILQPTTKIATKQLDTLSDGTSREVFTGVHAL
jgi:CheY-like chemotaxis protein